MLLVKAQSLNEQQDYSRFLNQSSSYRPNIAIMQKRLGEIIKKSNIISTSSIHLFIHFSHTYTYALSLSISCFYLKCLYIYIKIYILYTHTYIHSHAVVTKRGV